MTPEIVHGTSAMTTLSGSPSNGATDRLNLTLAAKSQSSTGAEDVAEEQMMAVRTAYEAILKLHFDTIKSAVEAGRGEELDISYEVDYKKRTCTGGPIHVAALYRDHDNKEDPDGESARLVDTLVTKFKVNIKEQVKYSSYKDDGFANALHLAAGRGNVKVIETLINHGADVNERTLIKDKKDGTVQQNQTALFEACFYSQVDAVKSLIRFGAHINAMNMHKATCLHNCAKQGQPVIARILVEGKASVDLCNKDGKRALIVAVETGRLPRRKLYLFSHRSIDDVLLVAKHSAKAAADMLKDSKRSSEKGSDVIHDEWRSALMCPANDPAEESDEDEEEGELLEQSEEKQRQKQQGQTALLRKWVDLMLIAPRAAVKLLETVTIEPPVQEVNRHPLPKRSTIDYKHNMRCWYTPDSVWKFNVEDTDKSKRSPDWHNKFAKNAYEDTHQMQRTRSWNLTSYFNRASGAACDVVGAVTADLQGNEFAYAQSKKELVSVNIMMIGLPGLLSPEVMYCLASTPRLGVFATMPVQAIVNCAWKGCARSFYWLNTIYRLIELGIMLLWVMAPDKVRENSFFVRITWSIAFAIALRDAVTEVHEIMGYYQISRLKWYVGNFRNFLDYVALATIFYLLLWSWDDYVVTRDPVALCGVVLYRWVIVILNFRAASGLGKQILPLIHSLLPMLGIFFVILMFFMMFLHAFMALEMRNDPADREHLKVVLGTFGLLLVGDGGGIETILPLGGAGDQGDAYTIPLYFASVITFCVILLNLFIAVHGEAYNTAHERTEAAFLQERAAICLQCLMRPCWPPTICGRQLLPEFFHHLRYARLIAQLFALFLFLVACWITSLDSVHPSVPALVALFGMTHYDSLMLQRPWVRAQKRRQAGSNRLTHTSTQDHYLWICARADHDPSAIAPSEARGEQDAEEPGQDSTASSLSMLRSMNNEACRKMTRTVASMRKDVCKDLQGADGSTLSDMRGEVRNLSGRLKNLEDNMANTQHMVNLLVQHLLPDHAKGPSCQGVPTNQQMSQTWPPAGGRAPPLAPHPQSQVPQPGLAKPEGLLQPPPPPSYPPPSEPPTPPPAEDLK